MARRLFWGFRPWRSPNGVTVFVGEPEKALLDLVYLSRRAGEPIWIDIDFSTLDRRKLRRYASRFPVSVARAVEELRAQQSPA